MKLMSLATPWKPSQRGKLYIRTDLPKTWARSVAMRRWLWLYRQHPGAMVQQMWAEEMFGGER